MSDYPGEFWACHPGWCAVPASYCWKSGVRLLYWMIALQLRWGGMLFRFSGTLVNIVNCCDIYRIAERLHMDPALICLAVSSRDRSWLVLFEVLYDFLACNFATDTVESYPIEISTQVKRQEVDYEPVGPVLAPAIEARWLHGVTHTIIFDVKRDHRRYPGSVTDDGRLSADVLADVGDDLNDVFAQEALCETGHGSFTTAGDLSVIATALAMLSKGVPSFASELANLVVVYLMLLKHLVRLQPRTTKSSGGERGSRLLHRSQIIAISTKLRVCVSEWQLPVSTLWGYSLARRWLRVRLQTLLQRYVKRMMWFICRVGS